MMRTAYVLMAYMPYEGGYLQGVYSTYANAQQAKESLAHQVWAEGELRIIPYAIDTHPRYVNELDAQDLEAAMLAAHNHPSIPHADHAAAGSRQA